MEIYNLVRASIILLVTIESSLYKVYNFPSSLTTGLNRFKDWIWGIQWKGKYAKYHEIRKLNGHLTLEATKLTLELTIFRFPNAIRVMVGKR